MDAPTPILCSTCGYDVTNLAEPARSSPATILCSECGAPVALSLTDQRFTQRLSIRKAAGVFLALHLHPITIWKHVPFRTRGIFLFNAILAAESVMIATNTHTVLTSTGSSCRGDPFVRMDGFLLLLFAVLFTTAIISLIASLVSACCRWRIPSQVFWAVIDYATMLWPTGLLLITLAYIALDSLGLYPASDYEHIIALTSLLFTPSLVLIITLIGLYSLRGVHAPPTPRSPPPE